MSNAFSVCGIYAIVNNVTGRVYIGMTTYAIARRWSQHISDLNRGKHCNKELQADWLELGSGGFDFSVIESFAIGARLMGLKALERRYITTSDCWLYNATVEIPRRSDHADIYWLYNPISFS